MTAPDHTSVEAKSSAREDDIRAMKVQMSATEDDIRAMNQQLVASTQLLVALNQQLAADKQLVVELYKATYSTDQRHGIQHLRLKRGARRVVEYMHS